MWKSPLLEADLHAIYQWDSHGPLRHARSGPWLRKRVEALPFHPSSMVAAQIHAEIDQARKARAESENPSGTVRQLRAG